MSELTQMGFDCNTDKAYWHRFTDVYSNWFETKRASATNILEIGVLHGSSVRLFEKYFTNAKIDALDIFPKQEHDSERVSTFIVDQSDKHQLQSFATPREGLYDIILDDGSHRSSDQMLTLTELWSCLKPGGLYVIEDLHTSAPVCNSSSANYSVKKWSETGQLESDYLNPDQINALMQSCEKVVWWKRETLPYRCWNCKTHPSSSTVCGCGIDLINDGNGSITCCITKRT